MKLNLKNPLMQVSAALSTFFMASTAFADTDDSFLGVSQTAGSNIYAATNIISTASYVAGAGFTVAALRGFQQHAENPGNHPIHKPLVKVLVGAGLIATPWVVNTAFNSVGVNELQSTGVAGTSNRL